MVSLVYLLRSCITAPFGIAGMLPVRGTFSAAVAVLGLPLASCALNALLPPQCDPSPGLIINLHFRISFGMTLKSSTIRRSSAFTCIVRIFLNLICSSHYV